MDEDRKAGLRAQLDAHHDWPAEYMFKFIAPNQSDRIGAVLAVFPDDVRVERKSSGGGKYVKRSGCMPERRSHRAEDGRVHIALDAAEAQCCSIRWEGGAPVELDLKPGEQTVEVDLQGAEVQQVHIDFGNQQVARRIEG